MFFIVGNWKMHGSLASLQAFCSQLSHTPAGLVPIICPPFPYLSHLATCLRDYPSYKVGAQDCAAHAQGAYTGEVSASMLKDIGCQYVIVGHHERGDTPALISVKATQALQAGLTPIICMGETHPDRWEQDLDNHCTHSLPAEDRDVLVAYEPIWAIGAATPPAQAHLNRSIAYLRHRLKRSVLYGGAVQPQNFPALLGHPDLQGVLVGRASLTADSWNALISYAATQGI